MPQPGFKTCIAERSPHRFVSTCRSSQCRRPDLSTYVFDGLLKCNHRDPQAIAIMLNLRRWHNDLAIEIPQHPFRPCLLTIDSHDAKFLQTDLLNTRLNDSIRLTENGLTIFSRSTTCTFFYFYASCSSSPFQTLVDFHLKCNGVIRRRWLGL